MNDKTYNIEKFKQFYLKWKKNKEQHKDFKIMIPISIKNNYILKTIKQQTYQVVNEEKLKQILLNKNAIENIVKLENQFKNFILLKGSNSLQDKSLQLKLWKTMLNIEKQKIKYKNKFVYDQFKKNQNRDCKVLQQIQKDLFRTDIKRYFKDFDADRVYKSIQNILYVYSKINNKVQYCQGMNFIATSIYYTLQINNQQDMEQESFWIFFTLMEQYRIKDYYLHLDKLCELSEMLELYIKENDSELLSYITYEQFNVFVYFHNIILTLLLNIVPLEESSRMLDLIITCKLKSQYENHTKVAFSIFKNKQKRNIQNKNKRIFDEQNTL